MALPPKVFDRTLIAEHLGRRPAEPDDFVTQLALDDLEAHLAELASVEAQALRKARGTQAIIEDSP